MGTFRITIELGDPGGKDFEPVEVLVDTGSTYTFVPTSVLRRLGVEPYEGWPFRLADGRQVEYQVGQTLVRIEGRIRYTTVVFGDEGTQPLLGAVTLEEFGLAADPVERRLIHVPALLMTFR